ncbi:MAG: hypothetical protein HRU09_04640 [Oligoflexales bacterium]|nr:hypothetical protein [Oligoflexales bacterium]
MERYRIERGYCLNLIQNLSNYLNKIQPPPNFASLSSGNENFITYIFVMTMSSTSEGGMLEEIGLGSSIFKKISEAIKSFALVKADADGMSLAMSDDDILFHQVIEKISQEKVKKSWYLDAARIRYLVAKSPSPFGEIFWHQGVQVLENLLLGIGQGTITDIQGGVAFIEKNFGEDDLSHKITEKHAEQLLFDLKARGLVEFSHYAPAIKEASPVEDKLLLTDAAFRLTAIHFANICGENTLIPEYLLSLYPSWQTAVLCKNKSLLEDIHIIMQLLALPLAPASIELLLSFVPESFIKKDQETFAGFLQNTFSPDRRAAFCRAIGKLEDSSLVTKLLVPVASSDSSKVVRNTALTVLHEDKGQVVQELKLQNARGDLGVFPVVR